MLGSKPQQLEIVLLTVNALVLSFVFALTAATVVERKVTASAIAAVCRTVSLEVLSLQRKLSEDAVAFMRELSSAQSKEPTLGVGCRVVHSRHGSGHIRDQTCDDKGHSCWLVVFETGEQRHYSPEAALEKLRMSSERLSSTTETGVRLREFRSGLGSRVVTSSAVMWPDVI
jgi:hypothetical protein